MKNNNALLTEVKQKANIKSIENLSLEETKKIVKLIGEDKIKKEHLEALTQFSPGFIDSITDMVNAIPRLVEIVGGVNEQALNKIDHLNQTTKALSTLASNVKSDQEKIEIAKLIVQVAKDYNKTIEAINFENNNTWQKITTVLGTTIVAVAVVVLHKLGIDPE